MITMKGNRPHFISIDEDGDINIEWIGDKKRIILGTDYNNKKTYMFCIDLESYNEIDVRNQSEVDKAFEWIKNE